MGYTQGLNPYGALNAPGIMTPRVSWALGLDAMREVIEVTRVLALDLSTFLCFNVQPPHSCLGETFTINKDGKEVRHMSHN